MLLSDVEVSSLRRRSVSLLVAGALAVAVSVSTFGFSGAGPRALAATDGASDIADATCAEDQVEGFAPLQLEPSVEPPESVTPREDARLRGRWRKLPRSPLRSEDGIGVWTGQQMIVSDTGSRRTAGYDPQTRTWTTYPRAPLSLTGAQAVWTGQEMVVTARGPERVLTMALDPASATWRELPPMPGGLAYVNASVWTGDAVIVSSSGPDESSRAGMRRIAAFYPAAGCWVALPDVPGGPRLRSLHATEHGLLAVTGDDELEMSPTVSILDPGTGAWSVASPSDVVDEGNAYVWTGSELVTLSGERNDGQLRNAAYDPATDSWRALDPECAIGTIHAVWTGQLIISAWPWAFDPATGACVKLPPRRDRTRGLPVRVWAGDRVIEWSGSQGDLITPLSDGIEYRPR